MSQLDQDSRFDRKRQTVYFTNAPAYCDNEETDDRDLWETQYDNGNDQDGEDDDDE